MVSNNKAVCLRSLPCCLWGNQRRGILELKDFIYIFNRKVRSAGSQAYEIRAERGAIERCYSPFSFSPLIDSKEYCCKQAVDYAGLNSSIEHSSNSSFRKLFI